MVILKNLAIAVIGLIIAAFLYALIKPGALSRLTPPAATSTEVAATSAAPQLVTYSNTTFGMTFEYPAEYVMKEVDLSTAYKKHNEIMLVRSGDAAPPANGEGQAGITIDVYENDKNALSLDQWLAASSSNFYLRNGSYASTTIAGEGGVQYHWSGLYEADTSAFTHRGNIVSITVTYISPEDENVAVYRQLLQTLQLQ